MTTKPSKVTELYAKLKEGIQSFYSSDSWREYLTFQSRFYNYSSRNVALIYLQCPSASHVAGFDDWKSLGRFVKRGETSIKIMAPNFRKEKDEKTGEEKRVLSGFHQTSVFDVSQTAGSELPTLTNELKMDTPSLRAFYEIAKSVCPVPVEEVTIKDGSKGYYDRTSHSIGIKKGMAALQKCKTLVHEMAHAMLHQKTEKSRELKEVEAEGTAFVVLSHFGFDTSQYSLAYVAGWNASQDADNILSAGETIQKTAEQIIDKLEQRMKVEQAIA